MAFKAVPGLYSYKRFFIFLFLVLLVSILIVLVGLLNFLPGSIYSSENNYECLNLKNLDNIPEVSLPIDSPISSGPNPKCSYYDCFNIYKCGHKGSSKILVYVYPLIKYYDSKGNPVTSQMSKEFYQLLKTITESKYYTPNPLEACLFVVSIDTLNQNRFRAKETSQALASLPQ